MDEIRVLGDIAEAARARFLELKAELGSKMRERVYDSAYGHRSSIMDIKVENEIIKLVNEKELPFNIFTEERGWIDRGEERTLIVDPIDGSNNAEHGIPFFSVSLAIGRDSLSSVEAAFVKNIPLNVNYWAIRGKGAYKNGTRMKIPEERTNLFVLYLGRNASDKSYEIARRARRVRDLGCASLEMITVAEGISDVFFYSFRNGGALRIVDIAAASLIVKEAGGLVLDERMNELEMHTDFKDRKNVIAIANKELKEVLK